MAAAPIVRDVELRRKRRRRWGAGTAETHITA
jgi:hypothetical protein